MALVALILLVLLAIVSVAFVQEQGKLKLADTGRCNHCLKVVATGSKLCSHCGLDPSAPSSGLPSEPSNAQSVSKTRRPSSHRWLCYAFYVLGWLFLASWLRFWLFVTDGSDSANVSGVVTLISSLGLLAVGRLIEVLQNIDDELYRKRMRGSP